MVCYTRAGVRAPYTAGLERSDLLSWWVVGTLTQSLQKYCLHISVVPVSL